jgi:hypothetical protein
MVKPLLFIVIHLAIDDPFFDIVKYIGKKKREGRGNILFMFRPSQFWYEETIWHVNFKVSIDFL